MRRLWRGSVVLLAAAIALGCAGEWKGDSWGHRLDVPYGENTVGAELGLWPTKGLDLYVQWVTPRLVEGRIVPMADESIRLRLGLLLSKYVVVRVVAVNHRPTETDFFEYDRWSLLVGGEELHAVVPSGEKPTAEGGYFSGRVDARLSRAGWVLFRRVDPGNRSAQVIYDFGDHRVSFNFPPILRR